MHHTVHFVRTLHKMLDRSKYQSHHLQLSIFRSSRDDIADQLWGHFLSTYIERLLKLGSAANLC